ncbi:hypothetical protein CANARDRAFT_179854, partial [[Candida] arabinofermentans NRRL YB-2248]
KFIRKTIKDFKIGKELGEGSYSTVMLATDTTTGRKYAVKILDKKHIIREKKVKYVNIEKNALNRLGNRNGIIHLFYTFQDTQNLYFVLDYASNGELLALIKKHGTMNEESVRYYSTQMIDAVSYMHDNGIIHRDLKPENILIDDEMKVQITDFGTAKILDSNPDGSYPSDTRANSFVGTAEYVSPELLNDKYSGKCSDIWALGCIIYQMIAGKPPFKATNEYLTFQKVIKLQYAFSAGFPMVIRDLVKRILVLKVKDRIKMHEIKQHHFFKDVNWNDPNYIWGLPPPELGPYKMSAKSMLPVPELNKNPIPKNRLGGSSLNTRSASATNVATTSSTSSNMNSGASTVFGLPNPFLDKKTYSSPVLATESSFGAQQLSTAAAIATTKRMIAQPLPKPRSASNNPPATATTTTAAAATTSSSSPSIAKLQQRQHSASSAAQVALRRKQTEQSSSSSSSLELPKSAKQSNSTSSNTQPSTILSSIQQQQQQQKPIDVIPGTNIPRPVLNTRINTSNSFAKNSSSFKRSTGSNKLKAAEIPPMSLLDMNWVQFLKHPDERVIKVGIVNVIRYQSDVFEKKYRGMLAESPLGYRNRELLNSSNSSMLSQVAYTSSLRKSQVGSQISAHYEYDDAITFTELEDEDEKNEDDSSNPSTKDSSTSTSTSGGSDKKSRFKNLFHYKNLSSMNEPLAKSRTLLVTTFGRALLFIQNHDRTKQKYQCVSEIDLNNQHIHFKEVIGDNNKKQKSSFLGSGLFAVVSSRTTLAFEVDKQDLSSWTNSLAKGRFMEQERLVRQLIEKDASGDAGTMTGGEAAMKAANIANYRSVSPPPQDQLTVQISPSSPMSDIDLITNGNNNNNNNNNGVTSKTSNSYNYGSTSTKILRKSRKPPPPSSNGSGSTTPTTNGGGNSHSSNNNNNNNNYENDLNTQRVLSNNSPMISAAINKAMKNTSYVGNSGLGSSEMNRYPHYGGSGEFEEESNGGNNDARHHVTSMNTVIVRGRYAGKKVVIVKPHDEGTKSHPFPHAIVAGVERQPLKITKSMGAKKVAKRTKVKPFVKLVNYNHLMPTRYSFEVESFKSSVTSESLSEPSQREEAKKVVKKAFEERHQAGKNKWFFQKLAF